MENLKIRSLTSILLIPLIFFIIWDGGLLYLLLCVLVLTIGALEFAKMYSSQPANQHSFVLLGICTALLLIARYFFTAEGSMFFLVVSVFIFGIWGVVSLERGNANAANGFAVMISGLVYFGWIGGYLISLRRIPDGQLWIILCLLLIWTSDTGAFFVGSLMGKHRMLPLVSPRKTWEGYFGGIVTCLAIGLLLHRIIPNFNHMMTVQQMLLLALAISCIGSIGDFVESMIKRTFKAKDSSNLIPGHGGFFDRLDTVLWVIPIGYFFYSILNSGLIQL
ncbi:MAG: CDP-archaeol synthase [Chloroflexi bacterium]|nr:CDP-archaeol synthase [Chloroflexota bacterium]